MRVLAALGLWWTAIIAGTSAALAKDRANVTIQLARDGARAVILLDRAVTRFAFEHTDVVRASDFTLLTPGLSLQDDIVSSATPFRRIEIGVRPATQQRDAKYPAFYAIGDGGVLFAPALRADPAAWDTRMTIDVASGRRCIPACSGVGEGFVFAGPKALVKVTPELVVVADPNVPAWLIERSQGDLAGALRTYRTALRAPLPRKPVLILKYLPDWPGTFTGDVSDGYVTAFRFYGVAWARPDAPEASVIQTFVHHEAFHFWNAGLAKPADGTPSWLHEGGAEYASLLGRYLSHVSSDGDARQSLSEALTRCRSGLEREEDQGLADLPFLSNQVRYPCGMVIQWAADLQLRRATADKQTILDAWGSMIRIARARASKAYDVADFSRSAALPSPAALRAAVLLGDQRGPERWQALLATLNELGADVVRTATPETRRTALLFHLLRVNCRARPAGKRYGFFFSSGTIMLDSPAGCGELTGNPVIKTIEGDDPFAISAETYAAVQEKCAAGSAVTLITSDGRTLAADCLEPLAAAPEGYVVRRWGREALP